MPARQDSLPLVSFTQEEFGNLPKLWTLHLYKNMLSGTIPSELGAAQSLKEVLLANNTLTGSIPSEIGLLTDMYMMFLSHNPGLTGAIPTEFSSLSKMDAFDTLDTGIDSATLPEFLREAQDSFSFHRYYYDCAIHYPCPGDGDGDKL